MSVTWRSSNRGQGLLEAIIGIGVIIAGTVGTITLVVATIKAGRSTNNQVVAASLAREGIEVVRNLRDTNWLKIQANEETDSWRGLFDTAAANPKHDSIPMFDVGANSWTVKSYTPGLTSCTNVVTSWNCEQIFQSGNVFLQEFDTVTVGRQASRFKRTVRLNPICRTDADSDGIPDVPASETIESANDAPCASGELLVGLQVESTIQWTDGGQLKSLVLEDRLYNWKYVK